MDFGLGIVILIGFIIAVFIFIRKQEKHSNVDLFKYNYSKHSDGTSSSYKPLESSPQQKTQRPSKKIEFNTDEIQHCLNLLKNDNRNLFITGNAGTGKSTLIQYYRKNTIKKVIVLAPTGLAALNAGGQTVHSFCHFPPEIIHKNLIKNDFSKEVYQAVDEIVLDEISMLRADLMDGLDHFMRNNGRDKNKPFGGARVILVGDPFQLPPVASNLEQNILRKQLGYHNTYFFNAKAFQSISQNERLRVTELTKPQRQSEEDFINALNCIRTDTNVAEALKIINTRVDRDFKHTHDSLYITLTAKRDRAKHINNTLLKQLKPPLFTYEAKAEGSFLKKNGDKNPDNYLPVDLKLYLKKGAKVIFVKNINELCVNGTPGFIHDLGSNFIKVKLNSPTGEIVKVEPATWEKTRYSWDKEKGELTSEIVGRLTQYPLRLAWALTIHKSQGMTFDKIFIDLTSKPFAHGQTYVSLSRCRTLSGLKLSQELYPNNIMVDKEITEFMKELYCR